jgi:hypothetical protein
MLQFEFISTKFQHHTKTLGLAEWLKQYKCLPSQCEALSSNPGATKNSVPRHFSQPLSAINVRKSHL